MASDGEKPASPAAAAEDPPAEAEEGEQTTPQQQPQKRRGRRKKGEAEAEQKTPTPRKPSVERPSRERKTVERYAELAQRATRPKKSPAILQGSGTKLKDIPNVSFKLAKRKADENLQSLHVLMYGRKSNVHFLKRNISQFSGFVWTDNQEKNRTRIKEKLEKFNKEKLVDFCEILDIRVNKATTKKEEISAKLLEFLESPCATRDVVLADKKGKKRGRKSKGIGQATADGASAEKKRKRSQKQAVEADKENDDEDDAGPAGSEDATMGEEGDEDSDASDQAMSDVEPDEPPAKKSTDAKQAKKETGSKAKENDTPAKNASTKPSKGASKPSQDAEEKPDVELESKKVGRKTKKSKETDMPADSKKATKKTSKSKKDDGKEGQSNDTGALKNEVSNKDGAKASNKNKGKGKGVADAGSAPTYEQLHAVVSEILVEVDFNTATLADILRQLGAHFKMDLMDRKAEVKRIIEEVINSLTSEEDDSEDDAENNKAVNSKPGGAEK
ncbi:hypothetical protein ACP70R_038907 [Stipagrostis hirtigluma subsp. patula]